MVLLISFIEKETVFKILFQGNDSHIFSTPWSHFSCFSFSSLPPLSRRKSNLFLRSWGKCREWFKLKGALVIFHLANESPALRGWALCPRSPSSGWPHSHTHQSQSHNIPLKSFISLTHLDITQVFRFVLTLYSEMVEGYPKRWLIFKNIFLESFKTKSSKPLVPVFFPIELGEKHYLQVAHPSSRPLCFIKNKSTHLLVLAALAG